MTMYNSIKNIGVKYFAPLALSASLLGGCGKEGNRIPVQRETVNYVQKETQKNLSTLVSECQNSAEEANALFNDTLRDRKLDLKEQESVYKKLQHVRNKREETTSYAEKNGLDVGRGVENKSQDALYDLLRENLEGVDYGVPELELSLRKQNVPIYVERKESGLDRTAGLFMMYGIGIFGICAYAVMTGKWR
jgi:hypothetical protein